jgi:hypothetical protein
MKLKKKRIKSPKELIEQALGNNAEPTKEYPDWDETFWADMERFDMDRKYQAERWDR